MTILDLLNPFLTKVLFTVWEGVIVQNVPFHHLRYWPLFPNSILLFFFLFLYFLLFYCNTDFARKNSKYFSCGVVRSWSLHTIVLVYFNLSIFILYCLECWSLDMRVPVYHHSRKLPVTFHCSCLVILLQFVSDHFYLSQDQHQLCLQWLGGLAQLVCYSWAVGGPDIYRFNKLILSNKTL